MQFCYNILHLLSLVEVLNFEYKKSEAFKVEIPLNIIEIFMQRSIFTNAIMKKQEAIFLPFSQPLLFVFSIY